MPKTKRARRPKGAGRVYEFPAGSGVWWAQLPERDGKSGPKWRVLDRKTGEEQLAQRLHELAKGVRVYDQSVALLDWIHYCINGTLAEENKATTIESYRQVTRLYIEPYALAKVQLGELGMPHLRAWAADVSRTISQQTGRPYAWNTRKNAYGRLRTCLQLAYDDRLISWEPPARLRMPRNGVVTPKRRALTAEECVALLEAARTHRRYLLFKLELVTGMRQGEIIGLTWEMFKWGQRAIHLTSQLHWLREEKRWERQTLKNNQDRYVVVDQETLGELRELHARYLEERGLREEEWNPEGLVFPTTTGTPLNPTNLLRDLRHLTEKAGIERITFHELRHTAGSLQLSENATMTTVSKNLGHSSVSVTAAIYAHAYEDEQQQAVSAVARRLGRGGRKAEEREEEE
jgi:integrase